MTDVSRAIFAACRAHKDRVAVSDGKQHLRYGEFAQEICRFAAFFECKPVKRVGFCLPNSLAYLSALFGAIAAGVTPFLLDDTLPSQEIDAIAADVGLDGLLLPETRVNLDGEPAALVAGLSLHTMRPAQGPDLLPSTVLCRFTSGTSGQPKCLEFSHDAVLRAADTWRSANQFAGDDVIVCLSGFYSGLAFNTSLAACFLSGARLCLYSGLPSPSQVLRYCKEERATRLVGFPVFYQAMVRAGIGREQLPASLTRFYSAASKLPSDARETLHTQLGISIVDYYGIAEAGPITHERRATHLHGNGVVLPDCHMRIRDKVLEVRSPYFASRYLNVPGGLEARMTPDGFYRTSDTAEIKDGRLQVGQRCDGVIDIGGKKFDPSEVERALLSLPDVTEAFVFSRMGRGGETETCAVVIGCSESPAKIRTMLRRCLASHKIPRRIQCRDTLLRNSAGKLASARMRRLFDMETEHE